MALAPQHVANVGFGTAGQAAAILLSRNGHKVEVFEQSAEPGPIGDSAHAMSPQLGQGVNMALLDARAIRDALRACETVQHALEDCMQARRRHVSAYQFWSRWLTLVFQSSGNWIPALRDLAFHPMGRTWRFRSLMLRVLSGTQMGWFGKVSLPDAFLQELVGTAEYPRTSAALDSMINLN